MCFTRTAEKIWLVSMSAVCYSVIFIFPSYAVIGVISTSTLLIGYYHGLLLRDTSADSLVGDLCSTGLLTAQELNVILSGHSSHHRSQLLLEYVQHLDSQALLMFSELVNDVWPHIGMQLITGVELHMYMVNIYACV